MLELPFYPEMDAIIRILDQKSPSFFLDSADLSRPLNHTSYAGIHSQTVICGDDHPWDILSSEVKKRTLAPDKNEDFFSGGLVGYVAYEALCDTDPVLKKLSRDLKEPLYWFGDFDPVLVINHQDKRAFLVSSQFDDATLKKYFEEWCDLLGGIQKRESELRSPKLVLSPQYSEYEKAIETIKYFLRAGDVYQINYSQPFMVETSESAGALYQKLRQISPAPYGACINTGEFQILSASPELLMAYGSGEIVTRPIKGTVRRDLDPKKDLKLRQWLLDSAKNRAELLMITDLERNDLGRVCEYGSVVADPLCELESFEQVHHLVSTIKGRLKPGVDAVMALKTLFPGGSVTGAPKMRSLEIINQLEGHARSIYTGALGYFGANGQSCFNLPIRTMIKKGTQVSFCAGGGITIDSEAREEYDEMNLKALGLLKTLGVC